MIRKLISKAKNLFQRKTLTQDEMNTRIKVGRTKQLVYALAKKKFDRAKYIKKENKIFFRRAATIAIKLTKKLDLKTQKRVVDLTEKMHLRKQEIYERHGLGVPNSIIENDQALNQYYNRLRKTLGGPDNLLEYFQNFENAIKQLNDSE